MALEIWASTCRSWQHFFITAAVLARSILSSCVSDAARGSTGRFRAPIMTMGVSVVSRFMPWPECRVCDYDKCRGLERPDESISCLVLCAKMGTLGMHSHHICSEAWCPCRRETNRPMPFQYVITVESWHRYCKTCKGNVAIAYPYYALWNCNEHKPCAGDYVSGIFL